MLQATKIGEINNGIDGTDAYYLVKSTDNVNVTLEEGKRFMYQKYAHNLEPSHAGGKFVSVIPVTKVNEQFEVIAIVYWRYDV